MIVVEKGKDYTSNKEINYDILRWINNRILKLLEDYFDGGNNSVWDRNYLLYCFPMTYIENHGSESCVNRLLEIRRILTSRIIYEDIQLLYKYILTNILAYYQNMYKWCKDWDEFKEEEIFLPLEEDLKKKLYEEYGYEYEQDRTLKDGSELEILIENLENISSSLWKNIFNEVEVDIKCVNSIAEHYLERFNRGEKIDFDFAYYKDLMNEDIKERYDRIKPVLERVNQNETQKRIDEIHIKKKQTIRRETLLKDICNICMMLQSNKKGIVPRENARNTYIKQMLSSKGYITADQTLCGESVARKDYGELDIQILDLNGNTVAIVEALNLEKYTYTREKILYDHLKKLIDNYNPMGIKLTFLVSYLACEEKDFEYQYRTYMENIKEKVPENYFVEIMNDNCFIESNFIKCIETNYKMGKISIRVYYIWVLV